MHTHTQHTQHTNNVIFIVCSLEAATRVKDEYHGCTVGGRTLSIEFSSAKEFSDRKEYSANGVRSGDRSGDRTDCSATDREECSGDRREFPPVHGSESRRAVDRDRRNGREQEDRSENDRDGIDREAVGGRDGKHGLRGYDQDRQSNSNNGPSNYSNGNSSSGNNNSNSSSDSNGYDDYYDRTFRTLARISGRIPDRNNKEDDDDLYNKKRYSSDNDDYRRYNNYSDTFQGIEDGNIIGGSSMSKSDTRSRCCERERDRYLSAGVGGAGGRRDHGPGSPPRSECTDRTDRSPFPSSSYRDQGSEKRLQPSVSVITLPFAARGGRFIYEHADGRREYVEAVFSSVDIGYDQTSGSQYDSDEKR